MPARFATLDVARIARIVLLPLSAALLISALVALAGPGRADAAPPACTAGPQPPRDINTYLLFAYTDLYVKGATPAQTGRGQFTGGNIGTNGFAAPNNPNLTFGSNFRATLSDGYAAVADRALIGPGSAGNQTSVWNLFTNQITNNDFVPASVRNAGPTCFTPPILDPNLPSYIAFTHSSGPYNPTMPSFPTSAALDALPDISVPTNGTMNLAPGDYGAVDINDNATLNLDNGIYNMLSLDPGKKVTINTKPGTEVRIAVDLRSNDDLTIQGSDLARFYIRADGLGPNSFAVTLGFNTMTGCPDPPAVHGQFFVPTGRVNLGDCTNIYGRWWMDVLRNDNNINVTYRAAGAVDGTKYLDSNGDGQIAQSDPGLGGFTFYVDYNDNNQLDPGEPSGVSDASGHYSIDNVQPGSWNVREVNNPAYVCSFPANCTQPVNVGQGQTDTGNDFANFTTAVKSGTKFEDLDADGADRENGEPGLPGWTIYVDYDGDGVQDANEPFGVTDNSGNYSIAGINPGTWKVREVGQPNWTCSFPQTSDSFGCYHEETFQSGGSYPNNNFGNWTTASKSGVKFEDLDRDHLDREPGEPGVQGFTIYVDYNNNGVNDPGEPFGISAADGSFQITGITPGTWKVREVQQTGWSCTYPATKDQFGCYRDETFQSSGNTTTGNNFGNHRGPELRHFQCYEIHRPPLNKPGVKLVDAFGTATVTIEKPKRLCAPANKNNEDAAAPQQPEHFTSYTIKQTSPKFKKIKGVTAHNQFGDTTVSLTRPDRLLVPTSKSLTGAPGPLVNPPDHYKCYLTAGAKFKKKGISVQDQFGSITVEIKKVLHWCPPVDKNDEGIINNSESLTCYQVAGLPPANRPTSIRTLNQFGPDGPFTFFGPRELCVPGTATLPQI